MRAHESINAQGTQDDSILECISTSQQQWQTLARRAQAKKVRQVMPPFWPPDPPALLTKTVEQPATIVMHNAVL